MQAFLSHPAVIMIVFFLSVASILLLLLGEFEHGLNKRRRAYQREQEREERERQEEIEAYQRKLDEDAKQRRLWDGARCIDDHLSRLTTDQIFIRHGMRKEARRADFRSAVRWSFSDERDREELFELYHKKLDSLVRNMETQACKDISESVSAMRSEDASYWLARSEVEPRSCIQGITGKNLVVNAPPEFVTALIEYARASLQRRLEDLFQEIPVMERRRQDYEDVVFE